MAVPRSAEVTRLLIAWRAGEPGAFERLMPLVYGELHKLARGRMRAQPPGQTLQTTALVHEAYLRLVHQQRMPWQNRAHFYGVCAQAMRSILVDAARARGSLKRGGRVERVPFDEARVGSPGSDADVLAVDEALSELAKTAPRQARVVEFRYFGGLTVEETAEALALSPETITRDWKIAKLRLLQALRHREEGSAR